MSDEVTAAAAAARSLAHPVGAAVRSDQAKHRREAPRELDEARGR